MDNLDHIREQNRWKPDNEDQKTDNHESLLNNTVIFFMVAVALIIDGIQAILLFFAIGVVVNTFIGIFAGFTFWLWFKMYDVSFVTPKQLAAMGGGFFVELIPALNALPTWTGAVVYVIMAHKALEVADKAPGGRVVRIATQVVMAQGNAYKATAIKNTEIGSSVTFAGKKYAGTKKPLSPTEVAQESQITPETRKTNLMSQQYTEWQEQMRNLNKIRRTNSVEPTEEYYNQYKNINSRDQNQSLDGDIV